MLLYVHTKTFYSNKSDYFVLSDFTALVAPDVKIQYCIALVASAIQFYCIVLVLCNDNKPLSNHQQNCYTSSNIHHLT